MRSVIFSIAIFFSLSAQSAEWKEIEGVYSVTTKNYLTDTDKESKASHYRIQLKGKSAKDLYDSMDVKPIKDDCTGGLAKNINDMQCLYFKQKNTYDCHFSINIATQKIEYGVSC